VHHTLIDRVGYLEPIGRLGARAIQYWWSIGSDHSRHGWHPISLDAAVGGDVVRDPAQVIFIISKNPHSTKPTVGIEDCMLLLCPISSTTIRPKNVSG
jgi:hypothetical protein